MPLVDQTTIMLDKQKRLLTAEDFYSTYLSSLKPEEFTDELRESHKRFISRLVYYFCNKYKVTVETHKIAEVLLPKVPEWHDPNEMKEAYSLTLDKLSLDYAAVLDQIFIQLGGLSFRDKAVQELKDTSRTAAHNYKGEKCYEQKKAVLSFARYFCSFDDFHEKYYSGEHSIKLSEDAKNIIKAVLYFEYGTVELGYNPLNVLLGYNWKTKETERKVSMEKLASIKCFKNGRMDLRFTSEAYACEFAKEFL